MVRRFDSWDDFANDYVSRLWYLPDVRRSCALECLRYNLMSNVLYDVNVDVGDAPRRSRFDRDRFIACISLDPELEGAIEARHSHGWSSGNPFSARAMAREYHTPQTMRHFQSAWCFERVGACGRWGWLCAMRESVLVRHGMNHNPIVITYRRSVEARDLVPDVLLRAERRLRELRDCWC